ncbi:MAG: hypothetical protein A2X66_00330 [Ignavibacteria bacterium GWA2_54_16]|nr:MAG: hypothetical protein A2X66_00330 [Ignavibacteria bacterium GWA2_54_16]
MNGRVALIAGGTGALGSELCIDFARQGGRVYATTRSDHHRQLISDPLWSSVGILQADVTIETDVLGLFDRIVEESTRIDVVVNTVGAYLPGKTLSDVGLDEWNLMMESNLKTAFLLTREAFRRMNGQAYGRIINISAMTGLQPTPGRIPYAISKHAVSLLTELAAKEVSASAITINAIAPGVISTPANRVGASEEDIRRWVSPSQIAELVRYLCSPAAGVINGTTIRLPGGS